MAWWDADPVADASSTAPVRINIGKQTAAADPSPSWFAEDPIADMIKNDSRESNQVSTLADVGYSAAGAPQEAVARVLGTPAAIQGIGSALERGARSLGAKAASLVSGQTRSTPASRAALSRPTIGLPDTAFFKSKMDAALNALTGQDSSIFYGPQTEAGRLTQEGLVGGLTAAAGGPTMAASGIASGVTGEGARKVFEDFPSVAPVAQVVGSLAGGGLPFAARGLMNMSRPSTVLGNALENVTPGQYAAGQDLMDRAAATGVPLTGPEALQQVIGGQTRLGTLQRQVEMAPAGEGLLRDVMAARPGNIRNAGEGLLADTFGAPVAPEAAANATQDVSEGLLTQAMRNRTDATQPSFSTARKAAVPEVVTGQMDELKAKVDAEIKLTGADNALGKKLQKFRSLLDQEGKNLGPLIETNRTYAENLYKKYNPMDPENTFNNREVAALAPFNKALQDILEGASPAYQTGLRQYQSLSPAVRSLEDGPVGRLAAPQGAPDTRLKGMSDEFLDPALARPEGIKQLASQIGAINPGAVPQLVGARIRNVFDKATQDLQSGPNPWGGAKFVTELMGNPQARANLQATIETLPDGGKVWKGWQNFAEVMQATGKRLPRGSDTQVNLGIEKELRNSSGLLTDVANADLTKPLGILGGKLNDYVYNANSRTLAEIFTNPRAVEKMRELAEAAPQSRRAETLTGELLALTQAEQRNEKDTPPAGEGLLNVAPEAPAQPGVLALPPVPEGLLPAPSGRPQSSLYHPDDRDALIRTLYGEAVGEGPEGQAAVAHVIMNRLASGDYGNSIQDVVKAPNQFEPWNSAAGRQRLANLAPDSEDYKKLATIVDPILAGNGADPTGGAINFIAPDTQADKGRKQPKWTKKMQQTARIGNHVFYR